MIIYEDIKKANETIKTTDIKGKEYAEVNQRIKAFRMLFPTGFIVTEMLSNENGVCVFRATVGCRTEEGEDVLLGTGTAYEKGLYGSGRVGQQADRYGCGIQGRVSHVPGVFREARQGSLPLGQASLRTSRCLQGADGDGYCGYRR